MVTEILLVVASIMAIMALYCTVTELFKMDAQLEYNAKKYKGCDCDKQN